MSMVLPGRTTYRLIPAELRPTPAESSEDSSRVPSLLRADAAVRQRDEADGVVGDHDRAGFLHAATTFAHAAVDGSDPDVDVTSCQPVLIDQMAGGTGGCEER